MVHSLVQKVSPIRHSGLLSMYQHTNVGSHINENRGFWVLVSLVWYKHTAPKLMAG